MTAAVGAVPRPPSPPRWRRCAWRHPEAGVAALCLLAWAALLVAELTPRVPAHAGHLPGPPAGAVAGLLSALGGWVVMTAAMMLPAALPAVREVAFSARWRRRQRSVVLFTTGYVGVWVAVGAILWAVAVRAGSWAEPAVLAAAALVVAAAWELNPVKARCLRACRRLRPVPPDGWAADAGCARTGAEYGITCAGACWALMAPMAVPGPAHLPLAVGLTLVVLAERLLVRSRRLRTCVAASLLLVAGATSWSAVT